MTRTEMRSQQPPARASEGEALNTHYTEENLWSERYEKEVKRHVDETDG
jgi:hypothetical protein